MPSVGSDAYYGVCEPKRPAAKAAKGIMSVDMHVLEGLVLAADNLTAKGWKIGTRDPEGKRQGPPRIALSKKGTKARFSHEDGVFKFSFQTTGGWGSMWTTVASDKSIDVLLAMVDANLKD